jgi:hypothetical protein
MRTFVGTRNKVSVSVIVLLIVLGLQAIWHVRSAYAASQLQFDMTTTQAGVPLQAARWIITPDKQVVVRSITFAVPSSMTSGAQNLVVVSTLSGLQGDEVTLVPGGLKLTLNANQTINSGTQIHVTISGLATPPAGTTTSTVRIFNSTSTTGTPLITTADSFTTVAPQTCRTTGWPQDYIQTENAKTGATDWDLSNGKTAGNLAAYAEKTSAVCGDKVYIRVNDLGDAPLKISAYRMGYYGGAGARLIWSTSSGPWLLGVPQSPSAQKVTTDSNGKTVNMFTASNWNRSFGLQIDEKWVPGVYLIKITFADGTGRYVPLTIRDKFGTHDQLMLNNTTTWQAYNTYGASSGYSGSAYGNVRSLRISYDRPYLQNSGGGQFMSYEYGYTYWAEKQGMDIGYATDIDFFSNLSMIDGQSMIALVGHPEYWPLDAAQKLQQARQAGTDLLSLSANSLYWRINLKPSVVGANREFEIFKEPGSTSNTMRMSGFAEQNVLGAMYGCANALGSTTSDSSWLWQGQENKPLNYIMRVEADGQNSSWAIPSGAQVVFSVPLQNKVCSWPTTTSGAAMDAPGCDVNACSWNPNMTTGDIVTLDDGSAGRVFHASSIGWACALIDRCPNYLTQPNGAVTATAMGQATMNAINFLKASPAARGTSTYQPQNVGQLTPVPVFIPEDVDED